MISITFASIGETDTIPAAYFITNISTVVKNNIAVGSVGNGFSYYFGIAPKSESLNTKKIAEASGNIAHSNNINGVFIKYLNLSSTITE